MFVSPEEWVGLKYAFHYVVTPPTVVEYVNVVRVEYKSNKLAMSALTEIKVFTVLLVESASTSQQSVANAENRKQSPSKLPRRR